MPAIEADALTDIAARLEDAVREAGVLARAMREAPMRRWTKGPSASPVCEADIAVDHLLREKLGGATFAGEPIAWLSEESADDPARLAARAVWIVDPIDGTRAYIEGFDDWSVSVALVESGRPITAVLYAPATEEFFSAAAGGGSTKNGVPIAATRGASIAGARISGPRSLLERVAALAPPFTLMPRVRSLALRLARVADGTLDAAIAGGNSHDWDLAAADLLVHEAGGALTPIGGGTVIYNRPVPRHGMLVAAGRERHAALVELLGDGRLALS